MVKIYNKSIDVSKWEDGSVLRGKHPSCEAHAIQRESRNV